MKKNIKDYIHFYVGQPIKTSRYGTGVLDSVSKTCFHVEFEKTIQGFLFNADAKLLLRPISDMTDKEMDEVKKYSDHSDHIEYYIETGVFIRIDGELHRILCKWGFDIFNLIESGLALDKTKADPKKTKKTIIQKN